MRAFHAAGDNDSFLRYIHDCFKEGHAVVTPLAPSESMWLHRVMLGSSLSNSLDPLDVIPVALEGLNAAEMTVRRHVMCGQVTAAWSTFAKQLANGISR